MAWEFKHFSLYISAQFSWGKATTLEGGKKKSFKKKKTLNLFTEGDRIKKTVDNFVEKLFEKR